MLADWSRLLRWTLCIVIGFFALARPMYGKVAWAGGGGDDDDDDSSASSGDDDGGGGDDSGDDDSAGDDDADQPAVTAGGLFTKETYPIAELQRPLTITGGMTELRAGVNVDATNTGAFAHYGLELDGRHGFSDNTEGLFNILTDLNDFGWEHGFAVAAAFEGSISYDLVDFRIGMNIAHTKTTTTDPTTGNKTSSSSTAVGIPFGFPFRYAPKPQIGVVALEELMTINFKGKPDFTPAIGVVANPIPALAIKVQASARVTGFNFSCTANVAIPASINIQYTPKNTMDFGGEFFFHNLKPATKTCPTDGSMPMDIPNPPKFYDDRALLLYLQLRL